MSDNNGLKNETNVNIDAPLEQEQLGQQHHEEQSTQPHNFSQLNDNTIKPSTFNILSPKSATTSSNHRRTESQLSTHSRGKSISFSEPMPILDNGEQIDHLSIKPSDLLLNSNFKDLDRLLEDDVNSPLHQLSSYKQKSKSKSKSKLNSKSNKSPILKEIDTFTHINGHGDINAKSSKNERNSFSFQSSSNSPKHQNSISFSNSKNKNSDNLPKNTPTSNETLIERIKVRYPNILPTVLSILSWYVFSMGISLYNKWMFSGDKLNFKYPIIITAFHQFILTCLCLITLALLPSFRLNYQMSYNKLDDNDNDNDNDEVNIDIEGVYEVKQVQRISYIPPLKEYLTTMLPCSFSSAMDIGLGNTAFRFITLSVYTMIKSSSLIFVLFWGVLFGLEKLTGKICLIVAIMTFGVGLMVFGQGGSGSGSNSSEVSKNLNINNTETIKQLVKRFQNLDSSHLVALGVLLVFGSACMSGLRWALTQILLKKNKRTKNPILTMLYISPGMCFVLIIFGGLFEGFYNFWNAPIWNIKGSIMTLILILIPGFMAFFMTISEFVLLQYASLLTLSIAGVFKELLTIFVSWFVFGDKLTWINCIGLTITVADIIWYNQYRFSQRDDSGKDFDNEWVDLELDELNVETGVQRN